MNNLGLAFYKLKEYHKSMNCLSEAAELYSTRYSIWFWMGVWCVKNYSITLERVCLEKNENDVYHTKFNFTFPYNANKPTHSKTKKSKIWMVQRPSMKEVEEKIPEKMRLDQAIKYFENVIISYKNYEKNNADIVDTVEKFELKTMFSNIPKILPNEEVKEEVPASYNFKDEDKVLYSQGYQKKCLFDRYNEMVKFSYLFLIFCYLSLENPDKAFEYCKLLKSDFKLSSKINFELKMYMAEIYLLKGKPNEAFKCLKIDQAFEESKDSTGDQNENYIPIESIVSGVKENSLPKRAVMFLNIATWNYFLNIPESANDAILNALDSLGFKNDAEKTASKSVKDLEIPGFLIHALVYLNLYNDDKESALKILKRRRFDKGADVILDLGPQ